MLARGLEKRAGAAANVRLEYSHYFSLYDSAVCKVQVAIDALLKPPDIGGRKTEFFSIF